MNSGRLDLPAPYIEPEDRQRHVDAGITCLGQGFGWAPFAAHDAIDVGNQEIDRFDIGIVGQEPLCLVVGGKVRRLVFHAGALAHSVTMPLQDFQLRTRHASLVRENLAGA